MRRSVHFTRARKHLFAGLLLCFVWTSRAHAQALPDLLSTLGIEELARDYLRPGADAVGYSLNSGLYHSARIDTGLTLWIGLRGVWSYVPDRDMTFVAKLPASLTALGYPGETRTATVFGGQGAVLRSSQLDPNGNPYPDVRLPGGSGLRSTFLMLPHVSIGSFAATELMLRGIPPITFDPEIGKVSFFGIGIKHSPTQYIRFPIDVSFMAAIQKLEIGRVMHVTNLNANAHASIPLSIAELYGGFGYESYAIDVSYTYTPVTADVPPELRTPQHIALNFKRVNFRFTLGVNVMLIPLLNVNAEYSAGVQDNMTIGAGLRL